MVKRNINKVKRTYRRASGFLGNSKMLNNPYFIGGVAGAIKNIINGKPAIDINNIQTRITQPNAKNPLLLLLLGVVMNNTALKSIGAFDIIDPPTTTDEENIEEDLSDEEVDKLANEIIANTDDNIQEEKIYIHK